MEKLSSTKLVPGTRKAAAAASRYLSDVLLCVRPPRGARKSCLHVPRTRRLSQIQGFQQEDSGSPRHPGMSHLLCVLCQKVRAHWPREELTAQAGFSVSPPLSSQGSGPAEFTHYRNLLASPTASPASVSPREAWGWDCLLCNVSSVFIAQSCLTPCDPMDCSPPGSSVHESLQARILEWVAISSSREGSSQPRDQTQVSCMVGRFFTV